VPAQLGLVDAGMNEMEMGEVEKPAPPPQRRRSPKYDETVGPVNYLDTLPFEGCEAFILAFICATQLAKRCRTGATMAFNFECDTQTSFGVFGLRR